MCQDSSGSCLKQPRIAYQEVFNMTGMGEKIVWRRREPFVNDDY